ncbi:MAG: hypothetical protein ACHP7H_03275 [Hyphomicrobiales bacterium]
MVATWAIDDGQVSVIDFTLRPTIDASALVSAAYKADEVWAHGSEFDRAMLETTSWWPKIPLTKWRCTMALVRMHGLPGGLDKLSTIFKLPASEAKDKRGHELIMLFCVPREDGHYNDRHTHPREWGEFLSYAGQDIVAMRAIYHKCPKWNATPRMWALWHLDQRMNERGVAFDIEMAEAAVTVTTRAKRRLADRTADMTRNLITGEADVESTTQRNRLLAYLADYGVDLPDLTADTVERRLEDETLPETIKELLRIRQQASKASTAKYKRVLNYSVDGRMKGMVIFCGAARTGRMAHRGFQPGNLPRPKHEQWEIDQWIALAKADDTELLDPEDNLGVASSALRGLIVASKGRKLIVADLAGIEPRYMAWVAGEEWKLDAFRDYDMGVGPDNYKAAIARSLGAEIDAIDWKDKVAQWRQVGKVQELALQYYGGVGAFCSLAETYHLDLDVVADAAWSTLPLDVRKQAEAGWYRAVKAHRTYLLEQRTWIVCQSLVSLWRAAHPAIVSFWSKLESAVFAAIRVPDHPITVGRLVVDRRGSWLRIRLPSGRYLLYPAAHVDERDVSFMGINPYSKQWQRLSTYGGKLSENVVQGGSADILMDGLLGADAAGYEPELTIHDEIIADSLDEPQYTDAGLSEIMVSNSLWADGLPLTAKGFTAQRYRK